MRFARAFNGKKAQIGDFSILVSERTIAQATGLCREGERWFKKESLTRAQMNCLLKPKYHVVALHKGFPRNFLREEWHSVLFILQKYITREARYTVTMQYHIRLLLHFESGMLLNFPYFLYQSLAKMSRQVKKNTRNPFASLHHFGLIKLLIFHELKRKNDSWEGFLAQNQVGVQITHTRVVPRPTSPHKDNREERLSDEDDLPLSEVIALRQRRRELQEKETASTNKVEMEKSKDERSSNSKQGKKLTKKGKKLATRGKNKTKSPSTKIVDTSTPLVLHYPADTFSSDDGLVIKNRGVLSLEGLPIHFGTKRKQIARNKVVVTSSEDDVYIISSTQTSPENKKIKRSMVKGKDIEVRKEMSPTVLDDRP